MKLKIYLWKNHKTHQKMFNYTKNSLPSLLFAFMSCVMLLSCHKKALRIESDNPDKLKSTKIYTPKSSKLNSTFLAERNELNKTINQILPETYYEDDSYTNNNHDNLKLVASKTGEVKLSIDQDKIKYTVPIKLKVDYNGTVHIKSDATIELYFETEFNITSDWKLETTTSSKGYKWIEKPKINNFFGLKVSVPNIVLSLLEKEIKTQLKDIAPMLDKQLAEQIKAEDVVLEIWNGVQEPILLDETYQLWLSIKPKTIKLSNIESNDKYIRLTSSIDFFADLNFGDKPETDKFIALAPLEREEIPSDSFHLEIASAISFPYLNKMVRDELVGYEYKHGKKTIIVSEATLFPNGDYIYVNLSLNGSMSGNVYLRGIPKIDTDTEELYFDNLNFDIKTHKAVIKVADFLIHGAFKRKLNEYLRFPLHEYYIDAKQNIEQGMRETSEPPVVIDFKTEKIYAEDIFVEERGLIIPIVLEGKSTINYGK